MRKVVMVLSVLVVFIACKKEQSPKLVTNNQETSPKKELSNSTRNNFPDDIAKIFKAHGGINEFDTFNSLIFEMETLDGDEKHTTDLKTRHALIEGNKFSIGFDGNEAWVEQDSTYFKGDPRFYHNLMFYFYAMPFVLGDEGIIYEKVPDLIVEEVSYPGYKISYTDGIGDSAKDNYFIYYDSQSYQMKFLGYTVTYFTKETSETIKLIAYSDWESVAGLLLPKTLKWRTYIDGVVGEVTKEKKFKNVSLSIEKINASKFEKPKL